MIDLHASELEPGEAWSERLALDTRRESRVWVHADEGIWVALTLEPCSHGGPLHLTISVAGASPRYPYLHEEARVLADFVEPLRLMVVHRSMRSERDKSHRTVYCVMRREGIQ